MKAYDENETKCSLSTRQSKVLLASLLVVAGVVYALISLVNHFLFKTYALDLGLYTHALYDYMHFRVDDCSMFKAVPQSILSDHFDLYLVMLSPLVYVFGSYTLLVVQILAVLFGGWGIYKLIGLYTDDGLLPVFAAAIFLFSFGIIQPFSFDYHSNVLTVTMLPWMLYFLKRREYGLTTLFVVLFVIGKENMALWLFFVVVGLMWDYRKERKAMWHLAAYAVFSIAYFFIVNMIVMPKLGGTGGGATRYLYLGGSYIEVAKNLLTHPKLAFKLMFVSTIGVEEFAGIREGYHHIVEATIANPNNAGIKEEFYYCALATGLVFTIFKPNYLFMMLPLLGQKMFASDFKFWGVSLHYSVEFMPLLVISAFLVIIKMKNKACRVVSASALLLSAVLATFYTIGIPKSLILSDQVRVYQQWHYQQYNFNAQYARELIRQVPDDASVSAASMFVPHMVMRNEVFDLDSRPNPGADYVMITKDYFEKLTYGMQAFPDHENYETVATDGTLYLLRRKP